MREYPVFVPWREGYLAAVVAVPDAPARGIVLLPSVPGGPRSHRHQVWAVAADRLARAAIASVRWDLPGLYDSTGSAPTVSMRATPLEQAVAVARFARR